MMAKIYFYAIIYFADKFQYEDVMNTIIEHYLSHIHQYVPELEHKMLNDFAQGLSIQQLPAKQHFVHAHTSSTHVFFVYQGLLKIYYTHDNGEQVNMNFFQTFERGGDYHAFLAQKPCRYSIQAIKDSILIVCPFTYFQDFCQKNPLFYKYLNYATNQVLFSYIQRTELFLIADAKTRYIHFLQTQPNLAQQLSVSDLCSYLGIQRQSLTRIRKQLSQKSS